MRYLEDLKFQEILNIVGPESSYDSLYLSAKFDGSYIDFSYDAESDYITAGRDPKTRYLSPDDWPDEPWSDYFRFAHGVMLHIYNFSEDFRTVLKTFFSDGKFLSAEILNGRYPNSTQNPYFKFDHMLRGDTKHKIINTLVIHDTVFEDVNLRKAYSLFYPLIDMDFVIRDYKYRYDENDGKVNLSKFLTEECWEIMTSSSSCFTVDNSLLMRRRVKDMDVLGIGKLSQFCKMQRKFANLAKVRYKIDGKKYSSVEIYDMSLSKVKVVDRDEVRSLKKIIKKNIQDIIIHFVEKCQVIDMQPGEGYVLSSENEKFFEPVKLINPKFKICNKRSHWLKHALVGGRRPPRPSFLSRTKEWPKEKRLERLQVLVNRFKEQAVNITISRMYEDRLITYQTEDFYNRAMMLFGMVQRDIENGR